MRLEFSYFLWSSREKNLSIVVGRNGNTSEKIYRGRFFGEAEVIFVMYPEKETTKLTGSYAKCSKYKRNGMQPKTGTTFPHNLSVYFFPPVQKSNKEKDEWIRAKNENHEKLLCHI